MDFNREYETNELLDFFDNLRRENQDIKKSDAEIILKEGLEKLIPGKNAVDFLDSYFDFMSEKPHGYAIATNTLLRLGRNSENGLISLDYKDLNNGRDLLMKKDNTEKMDFLQDQYFGLQAEITRDDLNDIIPLLRNKNLDSNIRNDLIKRGIATITKKNKPLEIYELGEYTHKDELQRLSFEADYHRHSVHEDISKPPIGKNQELVTQYLSSLN